jgi:hypothetical protein
MTGGSRLALGSFAEGPVLFLKGVFEGSGESSGPCRHGRLCVFSTRYGRREFSLRDVFMGENVFLSKT